MLKIIVLNIFFCLTLTSCEYFDFTKQSKEDLINNRKQEIKINGLEHYPQIESCDNFNEKECFESQLISKLKNTLQKTTINHNTIKKDTLWLTVKINKEGIITLNSISDNNLTIKETIKTTFEYLSPIEPAIINGIKVSTMFRIPILLKSN